MGTGLTILVLVLIAAAMFAIAMVVYFEGDPWSVEGRSIRRLRKLERLLFERPFHVRRECEQIKARLNRAAIQRHGFPSQSKGARAIAWCELLLSVLDHSIGKWKESEAHLTEIRNRFRNKEVYSSWLLRFYVLSGATNAEAVNLLVNACATADSPDAEFSRSKLEDRLRQACSVTPGMPKDDLREKVQWNKLVQNVITDSPWPWLEEARAWFQLQSWQRAERVLESAVERFGELPQVRLLLARTQRAMGNAQRARELLNSLSGDVQCGSRDLLEVADELIHLGEQESAEAIINQLDSSDEEIASEVCLIRARTFIRNGRYDEATSLLQSSDRHKSNPSMAVLLAHLYTLQGQHALAVEALGGIASVDITEPQQLWAKASAFWNSQDYSSAAGWFKRCVHARYRATEASLYYSRCLVRSGKHDEAADSLESMPEGSTLASAEAAFYRGVSLYGKAQPDKAFPLFLRAQKLATEAENRTLSGRAGANGVACYHLLAKQKLESSEFEQAAKAIERLRGFYSKNKAVLTQLTNSLAECHVRHALTYLEDRTKRDFAAATTLVERALAMRADRRLKGLLAGLYARQNQYGLAAKIYDEFLEGNPQNSTATFARALCMSRADLPEDLPVLQTLGIASAVPPSLDAFHEVGRSELRRIASQRGPFALRAALAVATAEARAGRNGEAAILLTKALRLPESGNDHFVGEARFQLVLFTLRDGKLTEARELGGKLLGGGRTSADAILGTLLAHEGDFETALGYLEAGVPSNGRPTTGTEILNGVYGRVAASHCQSREYRRAAELLARAAQRGADPELRQFGDLARMTTEAGDGRAELDDRTVAMLTQSLRSTGTPSPLLLRTAMVANQQLARTKVTNGRHADARNLWEQSFSLVSKLRGDRRFWKEFMDDYNVGKQYSLECTESELQDRVFQRVAGLNLLIVRDVLWSAHTEYDFDRSVVAAEVVEDRYRGESRGETSSTDQIACPNCGAPEWPSAISKRNGRCRKCG